MANPEVLYKNRYKCVQIPGAIFSTAHKPIDLETICNFAYDFQITRVECVILSALFSMRLNDLGSDPIPITIAKEVFDNQLVNKLYFQNTTTSATSKATVLLIQGFEY